MGARDGATPYELWNGKKPNLQHLRIFGSEAYVHVPKQLTTKFDARAKKMILVGYDGESSNYRLYDPVSRKIAGSRDVVFNEKIGKTKLLIRVEEDNTVVLSEDKQNNENTEEENAAFLPAEDNDVEVVENPAVREAATPRHGLRDRKTLHRPIRYELNVAELGVSVSYEEAIRSQRNELKLSATNLRLMSRTERAVAAREKARDENDRLKVDFPAHERRGWKCISLKGTAVSSWIYAAAWSEFHRDLYAGRKIQFAESSTRSGCGGGS